MKLSNNNIGTHLVGEFEMPYDELVDIFGEPHSYGSSGDKTDVEWCFEKGGVVFTLYNWKDGDCYNDNGRSIESLNEWHVGGKNKNALCIVEEIVIDKLFGGE